MIYGNISRGQKKLVSFVQLKYALSVFRALLMVYVDATNFNSMISNMNIFYL